MNRLIFAVLGIACFTAGWWVDAWAGHVIRESEERNPAATTVVKTPAPGAGRGPGSSPLSATTPAPARSVEDLLGLVMPGRVNVSRVRLDEAVATLSAAELAEFAEKLKALDDPGDDRKIHPARLAVLERWLLVEPARAAEHIVFRYDAGDRVVAQMTRAFSGAIGVLVPQDFARAVQLMNRIEDREVYIDVRWSWVHSLKGMDPEAATKLLAEFDLRTRNDLHLASVRGDYGSRWAEKDGAAALTWALGLPPGFTRTRVLGEVAGAWGKSDPAAAAAFLREVPPSALPGEASRDWLEGVLKEAKKTRK